MESLVQAAINKKSTERILLMCLTDSVPSHLISRSNISVVRPKPVVALLNDDCHANNFQAYRIGRDLYLLNHDEPGIVQGVLFQVPRLQWMEHLRVRMMELLP